jgi:tetratricopeptide (TPR) repeat protein
LASGFWSPRDVAEYRDRIDRVIDVAKNRISSDSPDGFDYLYLGGALGFKARFELMQRNWFASFLLAKEAVAALKTCSKLDPKNRDVLLGLGIFDYYTASMSGVLKFLSYFLVHHGSKEEGLRKLHLAASEAVYCSSEAKSVLLHNYLFLEKEFGKALDLAIDLADKYARNPRYLHLQGVCYFMLSRESEYEKTLELLRQESFRASSLEEASIWGRRALYLEALYDLYQDRYREARKKLQVILDNADSENDPFMIAWPYLKVGMSYDFEGNREKATEYYQTILNMNNGAGAQFLAQKYLNDPPKEKDPFIGY